MTIAETRNLQYATGYNLKTLTLISNLSNGEFNLIPFMLELNLFEDIFSPTISGEVIISDARGLISNFRLNGTEFIQVQLQKTTQDNFILSRNYRIYKISKISRGDNNDYENYSIQFCSEEFLLSEQYRISKAFPGTKISDIIDSILKNYLKVKKPVSIQQTTGLYDFVLPNKKIFETISWLSTYAQSASNNPGADMIFYENIDGYFFRSLQSLYEQAPYQNLKFDPKNITNNLNQKLTNATDFEVLNFFDTLNGVTNGTFANKVITIDTLTRTVNEVAFDYGSYFANSKKLNGSAITNNYKNRHDKTMYEDVPKTIPGMQLGTLRLATSNQNQKKNPYIAQNTQAVAHDIMIEKYLPNRVAQLSLANYTRIKVTIPGDTSMTTGKTVNFNIFGVNPVTYSDKSTRTPDPFYSGKYLVTAVRHIIKNSSYITIVEMSKESVGINYSNYNPGTQGDYIKGIQI
jgi:hypothetical protein